MSRRLLVTGGAGFIGSVFVRYWLNKYPQDRVVVLDALTYAGDRRYLNDVDSLDGFRFVEGDICDQSLVESLLRDEQLNIVVHFAAESHVDRSITGPDAFVQTNIIGTHSLLKAARQVWIQDAMAPTDHRFHHVSTDEVYGSLGPNDQPFTETTPYQPNSPYSASKASSDHLVRAYNETYGLQATISNCSNNYGPYQHPEKLIPTIILSLINGRGIPIYGDGLNVRDWLFVEDHGRGIEAIILDGKVGETYNVGGDNEMTNLDLTRRLCAMVDQLFSENDGLIKRFPNCPAAKGNACADSIEFVTDRAGHDRRYAIDGSKIRGELGYQPNDDHDQLFRETIAWYIDREA